MNASKENVVKSACGFCGMGCGILIHMKDGKPVKVEGDPDNPNNKGTLCVKGEASLEIFNHPDRLKYPMKRVGEKGKATFQRISWDEALDILATRLTEVKNKYGAEAVTFIRGVAKGYQDRYLARFANVFGSPNVASTSNICMMPRVYSSMVTYGFMASPDFGNPPALIVSWGSNVAATALPIKRLMESALSKKAKLVVIDPIASELSSRADIFTRIRPSSDLALAIGMINIIIKEKLYDEEFVKNWTVGFDKLAEGVSGYTPEKVSELTWIPAETVIQIARLYATQKPAVIEWGNGLDTNINSYQTGRAISILRAITGNLGIPGGEIEWSNPPVVLPTSPELNKQSAISMELRARRIGGEEHILPIYFSAIPQKLVKAMLTSKPYPIRAAYIPGANVVQGYNNAKEVYEAFKSLDFLAVTEFFMTATAELADLVLPATTFFEMDTIHHCPIIPIIEVVQKVAEVGECWSDLKIFNALSKKMGLADSFWKDEMETADYLLKPAGITFDEFRSIGMLPTSKEYRKYERNGFNTPSKKVELYSEQLAKWGFDPIPAFKEPPETALSAPELAKEYPLILTNKKYGPYVLSQGRQIKSLRNSHPDPLVTIHPDTAAKLGISSGDWAYIENKRGRIKHKANVSSVVDPRVITVEPGWWFPEKDNSDNHGWAESNINILTDNNPPYNEICSMTMKGILCKVYKA
jgi:anaerobic selenocysteine-containing dehydrogenase